MLDATRLMPSAACICIYALRNSKKSKIPYCSIVNSAMMTKYDRRPYDYPQALTANSLSSADTI